jgi:hypothetical protein
MSDDWRLRVGLHEGGRAHKLTERLEATELEHDLEASFHDRIAVSRDGEELFCYAGSREQAERAETLIRSLAAEHGWHLDSELKRWHESAEEWEDPDAPTAPDDVEHAELIDKERREAQARGYPEFEVRVQFDSHREASEFAEKLRQEGVASVQRWKYLMIGAPDQDSADVLAERIRNQAPPGSTVLAEGTQKAAYDERPASPFAFLGGLAG